MEVWKGGIPVVIPKASLKSRLLYGLVILAILLVATQPPSVHASSPTYLFIDGFESGDFSKWSGTSVSTGGTLEVQTSVVHSGHYAGHSKVNDGGTDDATVYKIVPDHETLYARAYVYVDVGWVSDKYNIDLISVLGGDNQYMLARAQVIRDPVLLTYNWRLIYWDRGHWEYPAGAGNVVLRTWHCLEVKVVVGSGDGEARLYVDGEEMPTLSVGNLINDDQTSTADTVRLGIGKGYSAFVTPWDAKFDDAVIADAYIGPIASIESCDSGGVRRDEFVVGETIYVMGSDYSVSETYPIYLVNDVVTWTDGTILSRVPGTGTSVSSDSSGNIRPTVVWEPDLTPGKYDIVVDVNRNGKYDSSIDALDDRDIKIYAGFFVVPEYSFGSILPMVGFLAACMFYRRRKY
jgi:hypothetical protein